MLKLKQVNSLDHVAIIMDGNGRWAENRGRTRLSGHQAGARRLREIVNVVQSRYQLFNNFCITEN